MKTGALEEANRPGQGEKRFDIPPAGLEDKCFHERAAPATAFGPVVDGQRSHLGQNGGIRVESHAGDDIARLIFGDQPIVQSFTDGRGRPRQQIAATGVLVHQVEDARNVFVAGGSDVHGILIDVRQRITEMYRCATKKPPFGVALW